MSRAKSGSPKRSRSSSSKRRTRRRHQFTEIKHSEEASSGGAPASPVMTTGSAADDATTTARLLYRWVMWLAIVLFFSAFQASCDYGLYDWKRTSNACITLTTVPDTCSLPRAGHCLVPELVRWLTPRLVSTVFVSAGPLWMWIPLVVMAQHLRQHNSGVRFAASALVPMLICGFAYLAFIMVARYWKDMKVLNPSGFDPSGHVLMYGWQLVPLWVLSSTLTQHRPPPVESFTILFQSWPSNSWVGRAAQIMAGIVQIALWYFTATTAAFYHTMSATLTALGVVTVTYLLAILVAQRAQVDPAYLFKNLKVAAGVVAAWWAFTTWLVVAYTNKVSSTFYAAIGFDLFLALFLVYVGVLARRMLLTQSV